MNSLIHSDRYALLKVEHPDQPPAEDVVTAHDTERVEKKRRIICRECGFKVTTATAAIRINGSHEHSFFNPHGFVFEIRCFGSAPGCMQIGPPSSEFSWFSGHTWQISTCALCNSHLGWKFQSGQSSFYGLIRNNIVEKDK